jgi:hypothetical protein
MGRKVKSSQSKSAKSNKIPVGKISIAKKNKIKLRNKAQEGANSNSNGRTEATRQVRTNEEFQNRINELRERSIGAAGRAKKPAAALPTLELKPATFQLPTAVQPIQTFSADTLVHGETNPAPQQPAQQKRPQVLKVSNRFDWMENDEILEDGTHSILKMDVKPATFQLPGRS